NAVTNTLAEAGATNVVLSTNAAGLVQTNVPAPVAATATEPGDEMTARRSSPRLSRLMAYGVAMFFALVGLGILIGHDISRFFAHRVEDFIFNDNLEGVKDPEYEECERVW